MSRPNHTGFDIKKLAAASGTPVKDPWAKYEAWRYSGPFMRRQRFKGFFPGFKIAVVAFGAYCAFEYAFLNDGHDGHGSSGHEDSSHE